MKMKTSNPLTLIFFAIVAMLVLAGCDSPELRKALQPAHNEMTVGMTYDSAQALITSDYSELSNFEYPYTVDESNYFGWDEEREISGDTQIMQVTKTDSNSICFFKLLFVGEGDGEMRLITIGDLICPA